MGSNMGSKHETERAKTMAGIGNGNRRHHEPESKEITNVIEIGR